MIDEVKTCVDARVNYFGEYFSVPDQLLGGCWVFLEGKSKNRKTDGQWGKN